MSHYSKYSHTEAQELTFIDSIKDRTVLAGYLKGCEKRTDWQDMDKKKIIHYAQHRMLDI